VQARARIIEEAPGLAGGLRRVFVFGAQRLGARCVGLLQANGVEVAGVLDNDVARHGALLGGVLIEPPSACSREPAVPVVIASQWIHSIWHQLRDLGHEAILLYPHLTLLDPEAYPADEHYADQLADLFRHRGAYVSLYLALADSGSRTDLDAVLRFRLTLDPSRLGYTTAHEYFEPDLFRWGPEEIFVDGGGYTGDTTAAFINQVGGRFRHIHVFEPDERLLQAAQANLAAFSGITYHQDGLYDRRTVVRFNLTGDLAGAIADDGEAAISVVDLDSAVVGPISFLKLDVEGAERAALRGAQGHIVAHSPRLAIAVYHLAADLWELPQLVRSINPRYRVWLRHYGAASYGTVAYFDAAAP
jgi:FkbM family methyltransferase